MKKITTFILDNGDEICIDEMLPTPIPGNMIDIKSDDFPDSKEYLDKIDDMRVLFIAFSLSKDIYEMRIYLVSGDSGRDRLKQNLEDFNP